MKGRLASVLFLVASIGCTAPRYSSGPSRAARPADIAFDPALAETARAPAGRTTLAAQPAVASASVPKMRVHFIDVGHAGGENNELFDGTSERVPVVVLLNAGSIAPLHECSPRGEMS